MKSVLPPDEARALLAELGPADEVWPEHCRQVARIARRVAEALRERGAPVDPDVLESWALVHDIGRSRDHGPLHGWAGYELLRARGQGATGRGCITHWWKGRRREELVASGLVDADFVDGVFRALDPPRWLLADSVMSFADSSVGGRAILPIEQRHADLRARYGESEWMRRHEELGTQHAEEISAALGRPVAELLAPLYDEAPDHA